MKDVSRIWVGEVPKDSKYIKPYRFHYVLNGVEKKVDIIRVPDCVCLVIFNKTRKKLVFVRQFRPAIFHGVVDSRGHTVGNIDLEKFPPRLGITMELCAGIVDKNLSLSEIAREELLEECGYDVPVERITKAISFRNGVDPFSSKITMYYCEVTDDDRRTAGGGVDTELIEVVELSLSEAKDALKPRPDNSITPGCLLGIMWFLFNKASDYYQNVSLIWKKK